MYIDKFPTIPTFLKTGSGPFVERSMAVFGRHITKQRKVGGVAAGLHGGAPGTQQALAWEIWFLACRTLNSVSPEKTEL